MKRFPIVENAGYRRLRNWSLIVVALFALSGGSAAAADELRPRATFPKPVAVAIDPERVSAREIVVKFHEGTHVRLRGGRLSVDPAWPTEADRAKLARQRLSERIVRADVDSANELLLRTDRALLARLFARSEDALDDDRASYERAAGEELADRNLYFMLVLAEPDVALALETIQGLNALRSVEISYAEPVPAAPAADIAPTTTIDLVPDQGYLLPAAQNGIDAAWANRLPGGRGAGIRVIDVESGWDKDHEDLPGSYFAEHGWNSFDGSHGAAALGVLAAAANGYGATGIVPDVALGLSSPIWATWNSPHNTAAAIDNAASHLRRGDILMIEQHYPELELGYQLGQYVPMIRTPQGLIPEDGSQRGYLPAEAVQAVYDSIRAATAKGIVVVEAAGNGAMDLDDPFWANRFDRSVRDSGAILVGAGSAGGREALSFSNFGSRVDLQGWGESVATLGYGENALLRANGSDARQWYTRTFGGTSSATPIVAGGAAAVNGTRLAAGDPLLDAIGMRQWLRATGTAQPAVDAAASPIGPLPDLSRAILAVGGRLDGLQPGGIVRGWAFHSGQSAASLGIQFSVDGPVGGGTPAGSATTSIGRPDVNAAYAITGSHGFERRIPDAFRDDTNHTLHARGLDPTGAQRNVPLDNPLVFNLPNVTGKIDSLDASGRVVGWAYAAQSSSQSLLVHAYVDGPVNDGGQFAGVHLANGPRQDVNTAAGISGNHGFAFKLPSMYRDGSQHTLHVYGIDPRGINDPLLGTLSFQLDRLPSPSLGPATLDFGGRAVGSSTVLAATLRNGGPGVLDVGAVAISSGPFVLDGKTCGATLAAGASCSYSIAYRPTSTGQHAATLKVLTPNAAASTVEIAFQGEGAVPQAQLDTPALVFGPVDVGTSTTKTVRLSNTGRAPVTIPAVSSWGGAGFSHTACPQTIAVGGSCVVTVTFAPTTSGQRGAWLRFADDGGGPHDVWLEGAGVPVGAAKPIPSSLSFGSTVVGTTGAVLGVTLQNTGGAALTVGVSGIDGAHWADFGIVTNGCSSGTVLSPAGSGCTLTVVFTPKATGPRQARISLVTSSGPAMVSLTGTGTAALVSTQWPAFGLTGAHGAWSADTGIDTQSVTALDVVWTAGAKAAVASSPAVADGVAVYGADDGVVRAVDEVSGAALWEFATGAAVRSSPAIAAGLAVVGSNDDSVYALDLHSGTLAWSFATGADVTASPAVSDGTVFVGSRDGSIYAVELATGKPIWSNAIGAPVLASPAVADHVVYVGADNGQLRAYEAAAGARLWTASGTGPIRSSPAVGDGKVFVGSESGRISAFGTSNGQQLWSVQANGAVSSSPALAYGIVYVGADDVIALAADTGAVIWGEPGKATSAPAVANGIVYVSTADGFLRAFDAWAGTQLKAAELRIDGSSPAVAGGTVFVGTSTGLAALRP